MAISDSNPMIRTIIPITTIPGFTPMSSGIVSAGNTPFLRNEKLVDDYTSIYLVERDMRTAALPWQGKTVDSVIWRDHVFLFLPTTVQLAEETW